MPRTQRVYPETLDTAIWAAKLEGCKTSEILRAVREGTLDGLDGPVSIAERTFYEHLARLRDKHGHEKEQPRKVAPGQEIEAAGAILRRAMELADRELLALENKARTRVGLTSGDAAKLERLARMVQGFKAREAAAKRQEAAAKDPNPSKRAGAASPRDNGTNPLDEVRKDWERAIGADGSGEKGHTERDRAREPVADGPHVNGTDTGTPREEDGGESSDARREGTEREEEGGAAAEHHARPRRAQAWAGTRPGSGTDQGNITQA